jgi:ubiquinone/menaquinone biosynthesis C-methylase UbiE
MPVDKSLFYYGAIYHAIFDPELAEARSTTIDFIPQGSSVLDIACGTGLLSRALREEKHCRVVGIDLSLRMLEFARKSTPYPDVTFMHADATDLCAFQDQSFDYATMLVVMHELDHVAQCRVLREALRVASKGIIVDAISPLPRNVFGIGIRTVEATVGHGHNSNFKAFLAAGGIQGILKAAGEPVRMESSSVFWHRCREFAVVSARG